MNRRGIAILLLLLIVGCVPPPKERQPSIHTQLQQLNLSMDSIHAAYLLAEKRRNERQLELLKSALFATNFCRAKPDSIDDTRSDRPEPYIGMTRDSLLQLLQGSNLIDTVFDNIQVFAVTRFGDLRVFLQAFFDQNGNVTRFEFDGGPPSSTPLTTGFESQFRIATERFGAPMDSSANGTYYYWNNDRGQAAVLNRGQCINYREYSVAH